MSIDTITLNLDPSDVVITTTFDPDNGPQHILTIEKRKAAFLANFILNGLTPADQARIPVGIKENIVQKTGLKYVFRLPSITRSLLIGAAAGIAFKTFSDKPLPTYFVEKAPTLVLKCVEIIQTEPYLCAATITGAATLSSLVSQETAEVVSDVLEGAKSIVVKTANLGIATLQTIKDFCYEQPKKAATLGMMGIGIVSWYQIPTFHKAIDQWVKFAKDLVK
ncbi:MAG TPA: hypothetical protein VLE96_04100 [Chlamydiales bacterium]|nr:hypothetical protein [Chlamydiales bacterium]